MKLVIAGVLGFAIAAAAGTMVSAKKHAAVAAAETAAHADSLAAHDSTAVHDPEAAHDSAEAHDVDATAHGDTDDGHGAGPDSATATQGGSHDVPAPAQHAPAMAPAHVGALPDSVANGGAERMARIFGAMKPEEAARLLEPMDDEHIRVVLLALSDRKAAAIMAQFKGDRAARLTRAMITNGGGR